LKKTLAIADGAAEKDLAKLTAVYEAMRPADAAALFQTMAPEFAAGFLGRMRPEIAAAVLAGMNPGKAYSISVLIAGRNATAPKT
jgi:flagellar motility protein MotE (MotC chaperone)